MEFFFLIKGLTHVEGGLQLSRLKLNSIQNYVNNKIRTLKNLIQLVIVYKEKQKSTAGESFQTFSIHFNF